MVLKSEDGVGLGDWPETLKHRRVSCRDDFNIEVLHAFLEVHEFPDLDLVQALRHFLWSFRLPGEVQKIDRMMEAFAQRYCRCNPGSVQSLRAFS